MANTKTANKELRKNKKRYIHNKAIKTRIRSCAKKIDLQLTSSETVYENLKKAISEYQSLASRAGRKNIFDKLQCKRKVSRFVVAAKNKFNDLTSATSNN